MLYTTSQNGSEWDEGYLIEHKNYFAEACYSNNLNLENENGKFLLIWYSSPYTKNESQYYVGTLILKHIRVKIVKNLYGTAGNRTVEGLDKFAEKVNLSLFLKHSCHK